VIVQYLCSPLSQTLISKELGCEEEEKNVEKQKQKLTPIEAS
jgi:hypothetical protein